jgi:adenylate cyclase
MKYRTKLYLALVSVSIASILLALVIFSTQSEKLIFQILQSRSLSIAASTAAQIDPELVKQSLGAKSTKDPAYLALKKELTKGVDANRRKDVYVADMYIMYTEPDKPNTLLIGVETGEDVDPPGSPYVDADVQLILDNRGGNVTNDAFITDKYGTWLAGYASIFDQEGKYIATLGADINSADISLELHQLVNYGILGLVSSFLLALTVAFFLSKKVTENLDHLSQIVKEIEEGNLEAKAHIETNDEFGALSERINAMTLGLQERDRLKMSFARYVSSHILEKILQTEAPLKLEGERRKMTLLFSDIRQFTLLAEKLPPEEVVRLLNEYFEVMIEVIFSFSGTLDKFIGDGIMAEFGAPLDDQKQEVHAIQAAIEMQRALQRLGDKWESEGKPRLQMGIGIHTGDAVVGNIGSEKRTEYTAIGDAVNVASRLEQATKTLNTPIVISESTYLATKDQFPFVDLGYLSLPGRKEQIKVFTLKKDDEQR